MPLTRMVNKRYTVASGNPLGKSSISVVAKLASTDGKLVNKREDL